MDIKRLGDNWNAWGRKDPMYAVLTDPAKRHNRWDEAAFFETGRREVAGVMRYVEGLGHPLQTGSALDFGCGVGRLTQALAEHFASVTGVDIAPSMIERADGLSRFPDRCRFVVNAVDDLSQFPSGEFDFVYSNIVLQHMRPEYARKYIREFLRIIRAGGLVIFQIPEQSAPAEPKAMPLSVSLKASAKRLLNSGYGMLTGKTLLPVIDMFGIPRAEVEAEIASAGGRVLDVVADPSGGEGWTGYRYCATKLAS
jgi:ubiquinone/menaquinone biosynthesis C-methylase UbiE